MVISGLVAHWTLLETSGLQDSVGSTCTFNLDSRASTSSDGVVCPVFSGSLGCAKCDYTSSSNLPTANNARTMMFWMKMASNSNDATGIAGYGTTGSKKPFLASLRSGKKLTWELWGPTISDSNIAPVADEYTHIALTYDGSQNGQFFKGGVASPTTMSSGGDLITPTSGSVVIGGEIDNNEGMTGTIKDLRIYDRVLSASEIASIMAGNMIINLLHNTSFYRITTELK